MNTPTSPPFFFLPILLTVWSRDSSAFQDTKIVFDFIGISSKAVEQVMMVPRIQMSLFGKGDGSRRARIFRRDETHRVTDHSQQLHLRQQIIDFSRLMMYPHRNVNTIRPDGQFDTFYLQNERMAKQTIHIYLFSDLGHTGPQLLHHVTHLQSLVGAVEAEVFIPTLRHAPVEMWQGVCPSPQQPQNHLRQPLFLLIENSKANDHRIQNMSE